MGNDQSSDSSARWRRTYASDFNAPRPAKRNLQNNTFILGTKFPTQSNWLQERSKDQEGTKPSNSQVVTRTTADVQNVRNDEKRKDNSLSTSATHSGSILSKNNTTFMGLSDEEFSKLKGYTEAELANHDKETDCWVSVSGVILDVTTFLTSHPGGVSVLTSESGRDATAAFKKHPNVVKTEESLRLHVSSGIVKIIGRLMLKSEVKYSKKKSKRSDKKSSKEKN